MAKVLEVFWHRGVDFDLSSQQENGLLDGGFTISLWLFSFNILLVFAAEFFEIALNTEEKRLFYFGRGEQ